MSATFEDEERDDLEDYSTIEETVEHGKEITLSYKNLSILYRMKDESGNNIIDVPIDNVIYDYLPELRKVALRIELSNEEYNKYMYRPDLLSYDLYGTTTYDFILLALNGCISHKYFNKRVLYIIGSEYLEDLISDIYNAELQYLTYNRSSYSAEDQFELDDTLESD